MVAGSSRYDPGSVIGVDRTTPAIYVGPRETGDHPHQRRDAAPSGIDGDTAVELDAADVGDVLRRDGWREWAAAGAGPTHALGGLDFAPLVTHPDKIVCVGLNYRTHILEMGHDLPDHPTLFAKYRAALIGAHDDIVLPTVSSSVDWEAELAVVIGASVRHASAARRPTPRSPATRCSTTCRCATSSDRTSQFLQGKTFEASTPLGPWLVTADELPDLRREIILRGERCGDAAGEHRRSRLRSRSRSCSTSRRSSRSSPAT